MIINHLELTDISVKQEAATTRQKVAKWMID